METKNKREALWWRLIKAMPVLALTLLLTLLLSSQGSFRKLETTALDAQMRFRGKPESESDIVVVQITGDDYVKLFQGKSPLDPSTLKGLISAIALGNPRVIGINIDTSARQFQDLRPEASWPPVVWARTAAYSNIDRAFHLFDVLGGQNPPLSALVSLKQDPDGALRRYSRAYNVQVGDTGRGEFPSFPWLLADRSKSTAPPQMSNDKEDLFIQYTVYGGDSRFFHVGASSLLDLAKDPNWSNNDIIKGRIVILGGKYAASDEYDTPLGWMTGADVLAYATQTELQGGNVRPASRLPIAMLQLFDGFVLLLLFHQFRPAKAVVLALIAIPFLSLICSFVTFKSFAFWAYFIPVLIAVLGQQLYDQAKEYRKRLAIRLYQDLSPAPEGAAPTDGDSTIPKESKPNTVKRKRPKPPRPFKKA